MKYLLLVYALLTLNLAVLGQEKVIFTDRPTVTDAVPLISPGTFQVEAGYVVTNASTMIHNDVTTHSFPGLSLKYGLLDWLELRVLTDYVMIKPNFDGYKAQHGIHYITFSPKFGLLEQNGALPTVSLATSLTYPYFRFVEFPPEDGWNYGFRLLFEYGFERFTWSNGFGLDWSRHEAKGWRYSTLGGYALTDKLGTFLEIYGLLNYPDFTSANFGLTYLLSRNFQADIIYGVQPAPPSFPDRYYQLFGFGLAWNTQFKSND